MPANTAPGQEPRETLTLGCGARVQAARGGASVRGGAGGGTGVRVEQAWGPSPGPVAAWLPLGSQC